MKLTFAFWNLNRKDLRVSLARIAQTHDVDILIVAECAGDPEGYVEELRSKTGKPFQHHAGTPHKLRLFTRLDLNAVTKVFAAPRSGYLIWRIAFGPPPGILMVMVHLPSKMDYSDIDQAMNATNLASTIMDTEERLAFHRTILVGDLNMNPFDPGMIAAQALHAVMTKEVARRGERVVQGRAYRLFYNPMWGCFGDRTEGPPGTFYLPPSRPIDRFWNVYDQVLLRPTLMDHLSDLRILDYDGQASLLTKRGVPNRRVSSDHLPLLFQLDL